MNAPDFISKYNNVIESTLRNRILTQDFPLYSMMKYHMGWIEKDGSPTAPQSIEPVSYFIGSLPLLVNESLGGDTQKAISSASAIVLVENSALIHQDIQDGIPERNGRPTLWWHWGPAQAINAGDGMHALGRLALLEGESKHWSPKELIQAVSTLDKACLDMCQGQFLDLTYTERVDVNQDEYIDMIGKKNASLVRSAVILGAISAGCDSNDLDNIADYGFKLGLSIQIRNDILDLWCTDHKSQMSGDILNKKKSLPIVYALRNAKGEEKHTLGDIYFKRSMENRDIEALLGVLDSIGARQYAQDTLEELKGDCLAALADLTISESAKDNLVNLAIFASNGTCE